MLAFPGLTLLGLAVILGIWLLVFGGMEIMAAFRVRQIGHPASGFRFLSRA